MLLADQGADVVKVDRPGNPEVESLPRFVYDRGKRRIALDLKSDEGLRKARELVDAADVVIENFRPGVMDRLGLGAEQMTWRNPGLVYLALPGFASTDETAQVRAFEGVIGAATAQFTDLKPGGSYDRPIYTPVGLGSTYGALHGAIAVTLALYRREDTGAGDMIEVPLAGAAMSAMSVLLMKAEDPPERYGKGSTGSPFMTSFQGGDGAWLFWIAGGHSRNTVSLCKTLGIYDQLMADGLVDLPVYENLRLTNNLPDSSNLTAEWNAHITERVKAALSAKPAEAWVKLMYEAGVPCALHRTAEAWLRAKETDASGLTIEMDHPTHGKVRQFGTQVHLSGQPDLVPGPAEALSDIDWAPRDPVMKENQSSGILEGIRVLDLSNVLAGPACARMLAEYGADVIKIDTMHPYFGTRVFNWFPMEVSPGKRSLLLNLKMGQSKEIFDRLTDSADVIVHNFRPGVAERLGIGFDRMSKRNPKLTYMNVTAMDGPKDGPWGDRPGFDPMVQAATGIQVRYGGDGPPVLHAWASCIDYITGYSGTFGVALGLLRAKRGGPAGSLARTSLAMGSQLVQATMMFSTDDQPTGSEPQGPSAVGEHSLHRLYQATDGWLFLGGAPGDLAKLNDVVGLVSVPVGQEEEARRTDALVTQIEGKSVATWVEAFTAAGFGCHQVDSVEDIRHQYLHDVMTDGTGAWDDGRSISAIRVIDHPAGTPIHMCPPAYARLKEGSPKLAAAAPQMGANTREILSELGYVDREIDGFVAEGVVKEAFHEHYLPR